MSNLEIAHRMTDAWTGGAGAAKGRPEEVLALFTDDIVYHDIPFDQPCSGIEAVTARVRRYLGWVDRVEMVTHAAAESGSGDVFLQRTEVYTMASKSLSLEVLSVMSFRDGKISKMVDYWDARGVERQLAEISGRPTTCEEAMLG